MKDLYVIGNGFDLFHKLPTHYKYFNLYVSENKKELKDFFEDYFSIDCIDDYWNDFEESLGSFDYKSFYNVNNHIDIGDDNFRPSMFFSLEDEIIELTESFVDEIKDSFRDWLETIDFEDLIPMMKFNIDAKFMTFNYTLLLEDVYKIDKNSVWHIHGHLGEDDLIFGHNVELENSPELDENGDSNRTMSSDSLEASKYLLNEFFKPVNELIKKNKSFFSSLADVNRVCVLGHSLNPIDVPYFVEINKYAKNAQWEVSFFNEDEKLRHFKTLSQIGIAESNIELKRIEHFKNALPLTSAMARQC